MSKDNATKKTSLDDKHSKLQDEDEDVYMKMKPKVPPGYRHSMSLPDREARVVESVSSLHQEGDAGWLLHRLYASHVKTFGTFVGFSSFLLKADVNDATTKVCSGAVVVGG